MDPHARLYLSRKRNSDDYFRTSGRRIRRSVELTTYIVGASFVFGFCPLADTGILIHDSSSAFERPATAEVLPDTISVSRVQQANALVNLNRQVVGIAGAALGSWLINSVGPR